MNNDILQQLDQWERMQHITPGYLFSQCYLKIFSDGSGKLVVELHTIGGKSAAERLKTAIGVTGRIEKELGFDNLSELRELLSRPLQMEYSER